MKSCTICKEEKALIEAQSSIYSCKRDKFKATLNYLKFVSFFQDVICF